MTGRLLHTPGTIAALVVLAILVVLSLPSIPALADDPTPTPRPTPRPTAKPTPTPAPKTLSELARTIRLQTPTPDTGDQPPSIVINNKTVYPDGKPDQTPTRTSTDRGSGYDWLKETSEQEREEAEKRDKWRQRYLDALLLVAKLEEEVAELDQEIPALQTKFYSWDDPVYRDQVIKPELDAALDRRKAAQAELDAAREVPPKVMREARRDGAKPGWFRGLKK